MPNSRTRSNSNDRILIRSVRRKQPDISKIAKAVISLALEQAAREAEAQQQRLAAGSPPPLTGGSQPTSKGREHDA